MTWVQVALLIATSHMAGTSVALSLLGHSDGVGRTQSPTVVAGPGALFPASAEAPSVAGIRMEIRQRLPLFQTCLDAAQRRGAAELRSMHATWSIAPDGSISDLAFDEATDAELAACLGKAGARRFSMAPGIALTIRTAIVFVR